MEFQSDAPAGKPLYLQIADDLEGRIRDNSLPPGTRLEAERHLSRRLGVARGTVNQAYLELERRGCLRILPSSGAYVQEITPDVFISEMRALIERLRQQRFNKWEIEVMAREAAWRSLPLDDRVRIAWIDCSPELLLPITEQIKRECNVDVCFFLLDEIVESPAILKTARADIFVTTINHYDEMCSLLGVLGYNDAPTERLVLSLSRRVVSTVAAIGADDHIAVFYSSANFRRAIEMFLSEYGATAQYSYFPLGYGSESFTASTVRWKLAVLPPDTPHDGAQLEIIRRICLERKIEMLPFESSVDYGSLLSLKERAQSCWLSK